MALLKQINKQTQVQLSKAEVNFSSNSLDQFYKEIYKPVRAMNGKCRRESWKEKTSYIASLERASPSARGHGKLHGNFTKTALKLPDIKMHWNYIITALKLH